MGRRNPCLSRNRRLHQNPTKETVKMAHASRGERQNLNRTKSLIDRTSPRTFNASRKILTVCQRNSLRRHRRQLGNLPRNHPWAHDEARETTAHRSMQLSRKRPNRLSLWKLSQLRTKMGRHTRTYPLSSPIPRYASENRSTPISAQRTPLRMCKSPDSQARTTQTRYPSSWIR